MARENQGLQIALIIAVMFTIVFMVTTFIFVSQYREAATEAQTNLEEKAKAETAARNTADENMKLKGLMGVGATESMDAITEQFNKQIEDYAASLPEGSRNYSQALQYLYTTLQERSKSLATALATVEDLRSTLEGLEQAKAPLIAQQEQRANNAVTQLSQERDKFNKDRAAALDLQTNLQDTLASNQKTAVAREEELQTQLTDANDRNAQIASMLKDRNDKINQILKPTFEVPDGKIMWVDQAYRTVWIDLGRADALRQLISFSVYPADTNDVSKVEKKASIEVTQILGDHLAEARIIEDNPSDPVMASDVIYTPVWASGEREHFALTDGIDVDNNGKSDLELVKKVITMNGGVVDCWIDDDGSWHGNMTNETRYLVVGERLEASATKERQVARKKIEDAADERGLTRMNLPELLNKMGYVEQAPVTTFGRGADPADFRVKPPEGIRKASTGVVSPVFRERQPPRPAGRSAY